MAPRVPVLGSELELVLVEGFFPNAHFGIDTGQVKKRSEIVRGQLLRFQEIGFGLGVIVLVFMTLKICKRNTLLYWWKALAGCGCLCPVILR